METFAQIVASRTGDDEPGLLFEDRQWTWDEVVREGAARAAALRAVVPTPEGRQVHVGVLLENVPDYVFWIAAASLADAVVVGLNASRSGPEIAQDARHADVDLVVTEGRLRHLASDLAGVPVLDVDDDTYDEWLSPYRGAPVPDASALPTPDRLAMLLFSSGSTGAPKAVVVGQGRLGRLTQAIVGRVRMRRDSVTYLCMPLFHGNAVMMNLAPAMATGATVTMTRKFSASAFADDIHRHGATYVNYVGRALSYVLTRPEDPRDRTSTLELAFGTEASEADVARFTERFGCEVMEGYGLSEGVFRINRTPDTPVGSLGLPAGDVDVRVLDEDTGEECPRARFDAQGRLVDGAAVGQMVAVGMAGTFEGYYKNPGAMADRVRGDDFWSGDLAYRDEAGYFYFAGRSSDWLRVDSENFSAAPVERVIQRLPWIAAAPVFAVPDPRTGDNVMVAVDLEPGTAFDPVALGQHLAAQPDFGAKWWPAYVRVVDRMPLTGSGKIDKAPLRRAAWDTTDPVWVRVGRTAEFRLLDDAGRDAIEKEFVEQGRQALLP
jgi:fatty-acyl-CoA synthase